MNKFELIVPQNITKKKNMLLPYSSAPNKVKCLGNVL